MFEQTLTLTGSEFHLNIRKGDSDLVLRGTSEKTVQVRGDGGDDEYNAQYAAGQNTLTLDLEEDLEVLLPADLTVRVSGEVNDLIIEQVNCRLVYVERVKEDANVKSVTGDVELGGIASDLRVMSLNGNLQVGGVGSDAQIKNVAGNITVRGVGGDLILQEVKGNAMLSAVGGDARITEVEGISSLTAGGDLLLRAKYQADRDYEFGAGGDIALLLDEDFAARIQAVSGGGVVNRFGGEKESSMAGMWSGEIGQGGPTMKLRAGGEIVLKSNDAERDRHIRIELRREEAKRARDEALRVRQEALRVKEELREQLRAQRDELRHGFRPGPGTRPGPSFGGLTFGFGRSGKKSEVPEAPASSGATEEERLKILKMLEDKIITADQAEMLLSALGE